MVFIYWGWDTTTSINEETDEPGRIPGIAGVISTFILLGTYFFVTLSVQSYAGVGSHTPLGLANSAHANDVLSVLGSSVFGPSVIGTILTKLLLVDDPDLRRGHDPDDDPAERAHDALDVVPQGAAGVFRPGAPALQDADHLDDHRSRSPRSSSTWR